MASDLKRRVKASYFFGIIEDESTDLSFQKKLILYIRYVSEGEIKTELAGNIRIPDGTATTISTEISNELQSFGDITTLVGLGSDGASVMFKKKGGVGVLLSKDSPISTHVHCVVHRLAIASSDAAKESPYLKIYKDTLKNLYFHASVSGAIIYKLEAMQDIMNEPHLRLKDPINIR